MRLTIANGALVLTGPPTCEEIKTVRRRFRRLFQAEPVIRLRGRFPRSAMSEADASDASGPDVWPFMNNPEQILFIGRDYVKVRLTYPIAKRSIVRVKPHLGVQVQIRFTLPTIV